jgi:hypothetical protein
MKATPIGDVALPCFLEKIRNLERGGADLVAESESLFSKEVFVLHEQDKLFLQTLVEMPKDTSFMIMLIGIPGVGKTELLSTLVRDDEAVPKTVRENSLWKTVRQMYSFMNLNSPFSFKRETGKKHVWLVPTVDEYYSLGSGQKMTGLLTDISKHMKKGDSIILAGNQGMFITQPGDRDPRDKIESVVVSALGEKEKFEKHISEPWIKEYGGDPQNADSNKSFAEFSLRILDFVTKHLKECTKINSTCASKTSCEKFQAKLLETIELAKTKPFLDRLCDLFCSIRLRHRDVYLTPRTLLVYWADFCWNLTQDLSLDKPTTIYEALFKSCLISSLYSQSHKLHETNLDIYRSQEIDEILLKKYADALNDSHKRRAARLKIYFEGEVSNPDTMVYEGAYTDFIDKNRSSDILRKVFRYFFVYADSRFQRRMVELEKMIESNDWVLYTFLAECWRKTKKEYITNMGAIDEFVDKYAPVSVEPIDFGKKRCRRVTLNLKDQSVPKPHFDVDLETFLAFRMLGQGFYLDFSLDPTILAKIEIVLTQSRDIFRQFLLRWFKEHVHEQERMAYTYMSIDGVLRRWEKSWT